MQSVNHRILLSVLLAISLAFSTTESFAEWSTSPYENNPVDVQPERASNIQSVPDGSGGIIIFYLYGPFDTGVPYDLLAQRMDADGNLVWGSPVVVRDIISPFWFRDYQAISDESGGAFIAMSVSDGANDRVQVQHVNNSGSLSWAADGVPVSPGWTGFDMKNPQLVLDDTGGIFVAWEDYADFGVSGIDIWVQRVDSAGNLIYGSFGDLVTNAPENQTDIMMARDGEGGAIFAWLDHRNAGLPTIYGQRLLPDATTTWTANGRVLLGTSIADPDPTLVEGSPLGGFFLASIYDDSGDTRTWMMRFDTSGSMVSYYSPPYSGGDVSDIAMIADGQGGAFLAWADNRNTSYAGPHYYVLGVGANGQPRWSDTGVAAGIGDGHQNEAQMVSDGAGGVVIVWSDSRSFTSDVYSQRISTGGVKMWGYSGAPISLRPSADSLPSVIADGEGGFLTAFSSFGDVTDYDVYAQRIDFHGKLGDATPTLTTVADHPQDQGGVVRLEWDRSYLDDYEFTEINDYTIWRQYGGGAKQAVLSGPEIEKKANQVAEATGLDKAMVTGQLKAGWSYVDQIDASFFEAYAYEAPTFADSTASGIILTDFKVLAHASQFVFWESDVVSGYSVDNLAPGSPAALMATYVNPDGLLEWSPSTVSVPDLSGYRVYRSDLAGFTPGPTNFVGMTPDTVFADDTLSPGTWYYLVTAQDFHDNESLPSNQAQLATGISGVGDRLPAAFRVTGAVPNPFNPSTKIQFSLAQAGYTTVDVFDARGHLVRRLLDRSLGNGRHDVTWDGKDDGGRSMPSGVYLAQVRSGDEKGIKKMVLAK